MKESRANSPGIQAGGNVTTDDVSAPGTTALLEVLRTSVRDKHSMLIGLSGGVDSALLAYIAHEQLREGAVAVTAVSASLSSEEKECARAVAEEIGIRHIFVETNEMDDPLYLKNDGMRCYRCKIGLSSALHSKAAELGISTVAIGVNKSDFSEYRPGIAAARSEGIWFPLAECGMEKETIRAAARELGLSVHDRPSNACLSSRIQYGQTIDERTLRAVADAEAHLHGLGIKNVRVRVHGTLARIEIGAEDTERFSLAGVRESTVAKLKSLGFIYVTLDMEGFRSGSMNLSLRNSP